MENKNRLVRERESFPLDVTKLTEFLHGGADEHKLHKQALEYVLGNTSFLDDNYDYYDLPRFEKRKKSFEDMVRIREVFHNITDKNFLQKVLHFIQACRSDGYDKRFLSLNVSGGAITGQGTQEQIDYYTKVFVAYIKSFVSLIKRRKTSKF